MDAVKFLKEQARICRSFRDDCNSCPIYGSCIDIINDARIEQKVEAVEKWSREHPVDVNKVKHGKWKYVSHCGETLGDGVNIKQTFYYQCSECSRLLTFEIYDTEKVLKYIKEHYPYCHCGARMDGDEK